MADAGSGVPPGCRNPFPNDNAECADDDADVGPLPFPSSKPMLPDRECALVSSKPPIVFPEGNCNGGRPLGGPMS